MDFFYAALIMDCLSVRQPRSVHAYSDLSCLPFPSRAGFDPDPRCFNPFCAPNGSFLTVFFFPVVFDCATMTLCLLSTSPNPRSYRSLLRVCFSPSFQLAIVFIIEMVFVFFILSGLTLPIDPVSELTFQWCPQIVNKTVTPFFSV